MTQQRRFLRSLQTFTHALTAGALMLSPALLQAQPARAKSPLIAYVGTYTSRQTISSLPPGFAGSNFCSGILVSEDGRFVYAGNRLHDSIGIFAVGKTGELTFVADEWTRGNYPRSFNFDPTGKFLYSCNQRGDNIAVFRVNKRSGALKFTGHYTPVGNPSIIVFHDLAKGK